MKINKINTLSLLIITTLLSSCGSPARLSTVKATPSLSKMYSFFPNKDTVVTASVGSLVYSEEISNSSVSYSIELEGDAKARTDLGQSIHINSGKRVVLEKTHINGEQWNTACFFGVANGMGLGAYNACLLDKDNDNFFDVASYRLDGVATERFFDLTNKTPYRLIEDKKESDGSKSFVKVYLDSIKSTKFGEKATFRVSTANSEKKPIRVYLNNANEAFFGISDKSQPYNYIKIFLRGDNTIESSRVLLTSKEKKELDNWTTAKNKEIIFYSHALVDIKKHKVFIIADSVTWSPKIGKRHQAGIGENLVSYSRNSSEHDIEATLEKSVVVDLGFGHTMKFSDGYSGVLQSERHSNEYGEILQSVNREYGEILQSTRFNNSYWLYLCGDNTKGRTGIYKKICLIDTDDDGFFDRAGFSDIKKSEALKTKISFLKKKINKVLAPNQAMKKSRQAIFTGISSNTIKVKFRTFVDDILNQPSLNEIQYDLDADGSATIRYKELVIDVHSVANGAIEYTVKKGYANNEELLLEYLIAHNKEILDFVLNMDKDNSTNSFLKIQGKKL